MHTLAIILLAVTSIVFTACATGGSDSLVDLTAEAEAINEISQSWLSNALAKDAAGKGRFIQGHQKRKDLEARQQDRSSRHPR